MKKHPALIRVVRITVICLCVIAGLVFYIKVRNTPPTKEKMEDWMDQNKQDVEFITNYLVTFPKEDIYIVENEAMEILYPFFKKESLGYEILYSPDVGYEMVREAITDEAVIAAMDNLSQKGWGSNIYLRSVSKDYNTVEFRAWVCTQQISCGIACTLEGQSEPYIQYLTYYDPFPADGWYYYVADYNKWREDHWED